MNYYHVERDPSRLWNVLYLVLFGVLCFVAGMIYDARVQLKSRAALAEIETTRQEYRQHQAMLLRRWNSRPLSPVFQFTGPTVRVLRT